MRNFDLVITTTDHGSYKFDFIAKNSKIVSDNAKIVKFGAVRKFKTKD